MLGGMEMAAMWGLVKRKRMKAHPASGALLCAERQRLTPIPQAERPALPRGMGPTSHFSSPSAARTSGTRVTRWSLIARRPAVKSLIASSPPICSVVGQTRWVWRRSERNCRASTAGGAPSAERHLPPRSVSTSPPAIHTQWFQLAIRKPNCSPVGEALRRVQHGLPGPGVVRGAQAGAGEEVLVVEEGVDGEAGQDAVQLALPLRGLAVVGPDVVQVEPLPWSRLAIAVTSANEPRSAQAGKRAASGSHTSGATPPA